MKTIYAFMVLIIIISLFPSRLFSQDNKGFWPKKMEGKKGTVIMYQPALYDQLPAVYTDGYQIPGLLCADLRKMV